MSHRFVWVNRIHDIIWLQPLLASFDAATFFLSFVLSIHLFIFLLWIFYLVHSHIPHFSLSIFWVSFWFKDKIFTDYQDYDFFSWNNVEMKFFNFIFQIHIFFRWTHFVCVNFYSIRDMRVSLWIFSYFVFKSFFSVFRIISKYFIRVWKWFQSKRYVNNVNHFTLKLNQYNQ